MASTAPPAGSRPVSKTHPKAAPTDGGLAGVVLAKAGEPATTTNFGALWASQPAVVVFLRRFGCALCRAYCQDLSKAAPAIAAAGGRLVAIGHEAYGTGSDADGSFAAGGYFTGGEVWVDGDKALYKALLGRKGLLDGYGLFDMSKERMAAVKERGVAGNYKGDGFQLGGTFVIDTDGTVLLDHRQEFYGDDASAEDIIAALGRAKGKAGAGAQ